MVVKKEEFLSVEVPYGCTLNGEEIVCYGGPHLSTLSPSEVHALSKLLSEKGSVKVTVYPFPRELACLYYHINPEDCEDDADVDRLSNERDVFTIRFEDGYYYLEGSVVRGVGFAESAMKGYCADGTPFQFAGEAFGCLRAVSLISPRDEGDAFRSLQEVFEFFETRFGR